MSLLPLLLLAALGRHSPTTPRQVPDPVAPAGWSLESNAGGWMLKPGDVGAGHSFVVVFTKPQKAVAPLDKFYDGVWASLGSAETIHRAPETLKQKLGDWDFIRGNGSISQGSRSVLASITALQNGDYQFSMVIATDSADTFKTYSPATDRMLVVMTGASSQVPKPSGAFQFEATFPADWIRSDGQGFRSAKHIGSEDKPDKIVTIYADEAATGSLDATFAASWTREVGRAGIHLMNPGLLAPEQPRPLRRRLKNGLAMWYEGGEGKFGQGTYCFLQLFMVRGADSVTFVACLYIFNFEGTNDKDRAATEEILESLKPANPTPKVSLFQASDCVGHWKMNLIAALAGFYSSSGAYLGDASSGGIDDLTLHSDGTYKRLFVGKGPNAQFSNDESGTWTLDDAVLTLTPGSKRKAEKHRVYGRVTLQGKTWLLLGDVDGARIPTDALETGAMLEMASRGGSLLRYEA